MIDTVRFLQQHLNLGEPITGRVPGWMSKRCDYDDYEDGKPFQRTTATFWDPITGVRVTGSPAPKFVQASLPKLLFGNNARLITTQAELGEAVVKLAKHTSVFGEPQSYRQFTRVDLVWHFPGQITDFISAHRGCTHPKIRNVPCIYEGQSINWYGKELKIRMYDKLLEARKIRSNVVRVEVQLQGATLKKLLAGGQMLTTLDIKQCYRAYRQILLHFDTKRHLLKSEGKFDWPAALFAGRKYNWTVNGVPLDEMFARGRNKRTVKRVFDQAAAFRPIYFEIDWKKLLPENALPPVYKIDQSEVQIQV